MSSSKGNPPARCGCRAAIPFLLHLLKRPGPRLIITVGNSFRSDDGVGPYISLRVKSNKNFTIIDAGETPENVIPAIVSFKPAAITFIDAANFGGRPGAAGIIKEENISDTAISTHSIPLNLIAKILREDTAAEISFIGIQPETLAFGEGLSAEVKKTADRIIKTLCMNTPSPRP